MTRILIICTGNSSRSQMAEGFLRSFDPALQVYSAGTKPARQVDPRAILVMKEAGVNISRSVPKNVKRFLAVPFDYVITVCDHARETCPVFTGAVQHRLHMGFDDPAEATGSEEEQLLVYRRVRDEMREKLLRFYKESLENRQA
jgi:arsenate reductase